MAKVVYRGKTIDHCLCRPFRLPALFLLAKTHAVSFWGKWRCNEISIDQDRLKGLDKLENTEKDREDREEREDRRRQRRQKKIEKLEKLEKQEKTEKLEKLEKLEKTEEDKKS